MSTMLDGIATWEENVQPPMDRFAEHGSSGITTEVEPEENPAWEEIFNALLDMYVNTPSVVGQNESCPNRAAIGAAINWITYLRRRHPAAPPTCVVPEPGGGIIIERRAQCRRGHNHLCELTFYNNGAAEATDYLDGRILHMNPIPADPTGLA